MYGRQSIDHLSYGFGQGLVRLVHVDEERVAASVRWRLVQIENRAHWRRRAARDVGVPELPRDVLGVLVSLDLDDLGMAFHARGGVDVELAEAPTEGLVLFDRKLLIAEEDHQVAHQRQVDLVELKCGERLAEINAGYLGADGRGERFDADRLVVETVVGHGVFPLVSSCSPVCPSDKLLSG